MEQKKSKWSKIWLFVKLIGAAILGALGSHPELFS